MVEMWHVNYVPGENEFDIELPMRIQLNQLAAHSLLSDR